MTPRATLADNKPRVENDFQIREPDPILQRLCIFAPSRCGHQAGSPSASPESATAIATQESDSRGSSPEAGRVTELLPLSELRQGARAIIEEIHLPASAAEQVMIFGFMSGVEVVAGQCGPGGCPKVYQLDGTEVAIRRSTARRILVRILPQEQA